MFRLDGSYVFSASDLSGFLACDHLPTLDRAAAAGDLARPHSFRNLAARYDDAHEATYLTRLKTMGMQVAELPVLAPQAAIEGAIVNGLEGNMIEQVIVNARRRDLIGELGVARLRASRRRNARSPGATTVGTRQ